MSEISHRIVADLLYARTGQQLTANRRWRIDTALAGLFRERGISNLDQLVCLLADAREEDLTLEVVEALLNNETYFFRDRLMFDLLANEVLPDLAAKRADTRRLTIWSAGCSTGQEALSLAMLFADQPQRWQGWRIDILGTDISGRAIEAARGGLYTQFEIQRGLPIRLLVKYFERRDESWTLTPALRAMIQWRRVNLHGDISSLGRFDVIFCRNVASQMEPAAARRMLDQMVHALARDGYLVLGAGEQGGAMSDSLRPLGGGVYAPKPSISAAA